MTGRKSEIKKIHLTTIVDDILDASSLCHLPCRTESRLSVPGHYSLHCWLRIRSLPVTSQLSPRATVAAVVLPGARAQPVCLPACLSACQPASLPASPATCKPAKFTDESKKSEGTKVRIQGYENVHRESEKRDFENDADDGQEAISPCL